jgi:hypothetical protein
VALRERLVRPFEKKRLRNALGRSIVDLVTLSQIANPILQTIFIAVIGVGYYFTVRATWATVQEMRAEHAAGGGRPLITVSEDYANLPNISLIVQNVGQGPAKDISFEFSAAVESSDGFGASCPSSKKG